MALHFEQALPAATASVQQPWLHTLPPLAALSQQLPDLNVSLAAARLAVNLAGSLLKGFTQPSQQK